MKHPHERADSRFHIAAEIAAVLDEPELSVAPRFLELDFLRVDEDEFAGLAINLIDEEQNRALLDYYAIAPEKRNGGYGSKGLEVLLERFKNYKYIFEIETQNEKAENAEERKRRKAFYLRNGLKETGLFVNVYDTDFELLTPDGELTFWEYVDFLREVMYEEYVEILRPTLIAMKKK